MLVPALLYIGLLTGVMAASGGWTAFAVSLAALLGLPFAYMIAPGLFYQLLLTPLVLLALASLRARTLVVVAALVVCGGVGYGIGVRDLRPALVALREEFPLVDLEERLAPLKPTKSTQAASTDEVPAERSVAVEDELRALENDLRLVGVDERRMQSLRRIHDGTLDWFVTAQGAGVVRMLGYQRHVIRRAVENPPPEFIPQPRAYVPDLDGSVSKTPTKQAALRREIHRLSLRDFLSPRRWGALFEDPLRSAGFVPHRFDVLPKRDVLRLELVGLLRHDEPVVYVSESLPDMAHVGESVSRPLNRFERTALPALATERDVVIGTDGEHVRMLGAIRAAEGCLRCHDVDRGTLLGAFSYVLQP